MNLLAKAKHALLSMASKGYAFEWYYVAYWILIVPNKER